jgi:Spy/CpxP family protein refolding chaperone
MSASLPAELNGFPGPRHVIELADQLGLTDAQRARATEIEAGMKQSATKLGAQIVGLEGALERLFRGGRAEPNRMEHLTREIGTKRGVLRSIHLGAHLAMADTLTADQRALYMVLRGYSTGHRVSPRHERRH